MRGSTLSAGFAISSDFSTACSPPACAAFFARARASAASTAALRGSLASTDFATSSDFSTACSPPACAAFFARARASAASTAALRGSVDSVGFAISSDFSTACSSPACAAFFARARASAASTADLRASGLAEDSSTLDGSLLTEAACSACFASRLARRCAINSLLSGSPFAFACTSAAGSAFFALMRASAAATGSSPAA